MVERVDLAGAVEAGIISADTAEALRTYGQSVELRPAQSEERFRLASGFNDFFVSIAAIILLVAVWAIGNAAMADRHAYGPSSFDNYGRYKGLGAICCALAAWLLAEYFTRIRRLTLPGIVLFAAFFVGLGFGLAYFYFDFDYTRHGEFRGWVCDEWALKNATDQLAQRHECVGFRAQVQREHPAFAIIAALLAAMSYLHWRRFRLPISVAAVVAAVSAMSLYLIAWLFRFESMTSAAPLAIILIAGIAAFAYAMWWDMADRDRATQRSDIAFWLHLLAAPMISHSVFMLIGVSEGNELGALTVVGVVAIYLFFACVALMIDRRALLVSALAYVLIALTALFRKFGMVELNVALTALIVGSALLILSAFWSSARRAIVSRLPERLRERLPAA